MSGPNQEATAAAVVVLPIVSMVLAVVVVVTGGGAASSPASTGGCGSGGTAQTVADIDLDAEQMGHAQTIVSVIATRQLPAHAAVIALATAYTESRLINSAVQTDHDSEGLFQQRVSIYTEAVAIDPVRSTGAFLDRLVGVADWQTIPVGVAAQTVQISAYPERYQPNAALAAELVDQFWPSAVAEAVPSPLAPGGGAAVAICPGAGGAVPAGEFVGPRGNNVAGTTTIPDGFVINGSAQGIVAVQYALAQLGKPYVWAAAGPDSFDCSGLTMAAWAAAGVALPHLAAGQTRNGEPSPTNLTQAVAGDLVMIPGSGGTAAAPGHVGMVAGYVDAADGRHLYLIQAPMTGIPVQLTEATRWDGQIVAVRHIA
ncbi:C40 family peptidase [Geodermatophilus sp. Leaf369]|uniref:C40 family peptidase n=1 Tax=Geodermatophilus sp. Leaf369 TaxID=1736354 RepID=UPI000A7A0D63|nr:NlpC/P60 family protein [Geodermatophilus sp. Leaf369]